LRARIDELERAAKPSEPFKPEPWQRFDPTANMSMPRSTMLDMAAAIPDAMIKGIVHDNQAPTGRPGVIPGSQQVSSARHGGGAAPGDGTGWARSIPFGPSHHQRYVEAQLDAQDARDRVAKIAEDKALRGAMKR
jgi:hypothetical protein